MYAVFVFPTQTATRVKLGSRDKPRQHCLSPSRRLRKCPKLNALCTQPLSHRCTPAASTRCRRSAEGTTPPGYAYPDRRAFPVATLQHLYAHLGPEISPPSAVDLSRRPRTFPGTTGDLPTLEGPSSTTAAARSRLRTVHRLRTVTISESCFPSSPYDRSPHRGRACALASPSLLSPHRA